MFSMGIQNLSFVVSILESNEIINIRSPMSIFPNQLLLLNLHWGLSLRLFYFVHQVDEFLLCFYHYTSRLHQFALELALMAASELTSGWAFEICPTFFISPFEGLFVMLIAVTRIMVITAIKKHM